MNNFEYLSSLERLGVKLGLENIRHLLRQAGDPQNAYPTLHVAGTNGKGSTVAVAASIAAAARCRVGRFTSPHLLRMNERFLLNSEPISDEALDRHIGYFRNIAHGMAFPPTYFELTTAVALRWFMECEVEIAVIEVGLGGRLDSTNVINPAAAAITNIALEHTNYLGPTIEHIAAEKAGIIKQRAPLVLGNIVPEAKAIIIDAAHKQESPVWELGREYDYSFSDTDGFSYRSDSLCIENAPLGLPGRYQAENAATGVALMEQARSLLPNIDEDAFTRGLEGARWPCRMEKVLDSPPVYIDVAHNPAGMQRLATELKDVVVVMAVSSDKDVARMADILAPSAKSFIYTQFNGSRATPADELANLAARPGVVVPSLEEAVEIGLSMADDDNPLLITGSIFAAGEARQILETKHGAKPLRF